MPEHAADLAPVRRIVIAGGGSAGWMAAAALSAVAGRQWQITLVESEAIGTVGVGEATIPRLRDFHRLIGLDEDLFLRETRATFKLGIRFVDWGRLGDDYVHGFGPLGPDTGLVPFHHHLLKLGAAAGDPGDCAINVAAGRAARFARVAPGQPGPLGEMAFAFHLEAVRYAALLRREAEARGVQRVEGRIAGVPRRAGDGFVEALLLEDGRRLEGDLFIDCTGFAALLIGQALGVPYDDWSRWLPCDRAWAVPSAPAGPLRPLTRARAQTAGWTWRIPLQHRVGNGHVFCSAVLNEDEAAAMLLAQLDAPALAAPRLLRFTAGRRQRTWEANVIAVGLAGGFLEPLESTSLHLIQTVLQRLLDFFPDASMAAAERDEFNRRCAEEMEAIRDFLVLHYHATERDDSAFWRQCRATEPPPALARRLALWRARGRVFREGVELFAEPSWVQVLMGQRMATQGCHPLVQALPATVSADLLAQTRRTIAAAVATLPEHAAHLQALGLPVQPAQPAQPA